MDEEVRIFPKSSAFEALLAKVYLELWELQDNPARYASRIEKFVTVFLPSMFQDDVPKKIPEFDEKLKALDDRIDKLESLKASTDPLTAETIDTSKIPSEVAELADEVWHAVVDVLTEKGFNFPMAKQVPRRRMTP